MQSKGLGKPWRHHVFQILLSEFWFADGERSKAVAVAALMGLYAAQLLPAGALRPCFIVTKNAEGAGASTLVSCAVVPIIGQLPTGVKSDDDDETRKALTAAVREARSVLLFDNQNSRLSSAALEAFISSPEWSDRLLGVNQTNDHRLVKQCRFVIEGKCSPARRFSDGLKRENGCDRGEDTIVRSVLLSLVAAVAKSRTIPTYTYPLTP